MRICRAIPVVLIAVFSLQAAEPHAVTGMVLKVDRARNSFTASCQEIPDVMPAMVMPFEASDSKELEGLAPGAIIDFKLVAKEGSSFAEQIKIHPYISAEQDPRAARQLKLLKSLTGASHPTKPVELGSAVPDFTLTDQDRKQVSLASFAGKVVALNFIYTSCALPDFCYRIANNFGVLQRKFGPQLGSDLVLLTVTFDPERDTPDVLARYSKTWTAEARTWHFLTGAPTEVRRVTSMFGIDAFPDEGLMNHSLHTAVIDRQGKLVANIEGNQFTANQLADLVGMVLAKKPE